VSDGFLGDEETYNVCETLYRSRGRYGYGDSQIENTGDDSENCVVGCIHKPEKLEGDGEGGKTLSNNC
jgi:hypothetical protein